MYYTRRRCIFTLVSRTNIDIDETLIEIAMRKYGVHTKTEAVDRALREVAFQPMSTAEILALRGTGFLDAPADQSPRGRSWSTRRPGWSSRAGPDPRSMNSCPH